MRQDFPLLESISQRVRASPLFETLFAPCSSSHHLFCTKGHELRSTKRAARRFLSVPRTTPSRDQSEASPGFLTASHRVVNHRMGKHLVPCVFALLVVDDA